METKKFYLFEKILLLTILAGSLWGFWIFEENSSLRFIVLVIAVLGSLFSFINLNKQKDKVTSKLEIVALLILYLGLFTLYNLLYSGQIQLSVIMLAVLALVSLLFFCLISLDKVRETLGKNIFPVFILLMGLVTLEVFLSLSFWPIDPEVKSLIIVIVFYLITTLIYLYIHNMLRLKKAVGYLIISFIVLAAVLLNIWLRLQR